MRDVLCRIIRKPRIPERRRAQAIHDLAEFGPCALNELGYISTRDAFQFRHVTAGLQQYARECLEWVRERQENPKLRTPPPKPVVYRFL